MTALFPDALDTNRAGRLTDVQRDRLRGMSRGTRKGELQLAGVLAVIGLLVWFAAGPARYATVKPLLGIAFLILAGALVVRALLGADSLTNDLRSGRVESVEGSVSRWSESTHSRNATSHSYYVQVAGVRVVTARDTYDQVPDAGVVRMYYLPHSKHLVNLERLADRPLPEAALAGPQTALHDVKDMLVGSLTGNVTRSADAKAELQAIADALTGGTGTGLTPPSTAAPDPRPLAEAIVGRWSNPLVSVTFAPDGSVSATLPGGVERSGRWSVDASGKLSVDVTGRQEAGDAAIAGDQLTISMGGEGLRLHRAS